MKVNKIWVRVKVSKIWVRVEGGLRAGIRLCVADLPRRRFQPSIELASEVDLETCARMSVHVRVHGCMRAHARTC